jgi:hypothetical protein
MSIIQIKSEIKIRDSKSEVFEIRDQTRCDINNRDQNRDSKSEILETRFKIRNSKSEIKPDVMSIFEIKILKSRFKIRNSRNPKFRPELPTFDERWASKRDLWLWLFLGGIVEWREERRDRAISDFTKSSREQ